MNSRVILFCFVFFKTEGDISVPGDDYRSHRHPSVRIQGLLQSGGVGALKQEY